MWNGHGKRRGWETVGKRGRKGRLGSAEGRAYSF